MRRHPPRATRDVRHHTVAARCRPFGARPGGGRGAHRADRAHDWRLSSVAMEFETILYEVDDDHVATITLNRPDKLNSFNQAMRSDFKRAWREVMDDSDVHCVVLRGAGERAFSSGIDVVERAQRMADGTHMPNPWSFEDPGVSLGPRANACWKPVVCAVHGMAAGGAFYWINESDIGV